MRSLRPQTRRIPFTRRRRPATPYRLRYKVCHAVVRQVPKASGKLGSKRLKRLGPSSAKLAKTNMQRPSSVKIHPLWAPNQWNIYHWRSKQTSFYEAPMSSGLLVVVHLLHKWCGRLFSLGRPIAPPILPEKKALPRCPKKQTRLPLWRAIMGLFTWTRPEYPQQTEISC